jgi:xanthine dehydrogenase accessory factor
MGSRRTHSDRVRRLLKAGLTRAEIDVVHSPIGLDLGARTPEETAVSIAAQIIAVRSGGSGAPLSTESGPIHRAVRSSEEVAPLVR